MTEPTAIRTVDRKVLPVIAIVVSRADRASEHVGERLLELADWESRTDESLPDADGGGTYHRTDGFELRTFNDLHIHLSDPVPAFSRDPDAVVFVSRHAGETGPLLTAHVTGNFGPAEYGGRPNAFASAAPRIEKRVVDSLADHAPAGYDVGIECTPHGPTDVSVPSLFVELGSDAAEWADPAGARAVARAVLDLRTATDGETGDRPGVVTPDLYGADGRPRHVVGFGGGHYAPRFTRIVRETAWAVGHVGADWGLDALGAPAANRDVIDRAFAASRAEHAVVEGDRPALREVVAELGHRVVSETWLREVGDRPLAIVEAAETLIGPVDEGLRFGDVEPDRSPVGDDALDVRPFPAGLLARAQGIDGDAARDAVVANAVAFDTEQSGTRAAGTCAFATAADAPGYDDLVADLAAVLAREYDEVDVGTDAVVASVESFDPALAAELGVPEGPAFGRLADGESVEIDGRTVSPADVYSRTTDRFPIGTATD